MSCIFFTQVSYHLHRSAEQVLYNYYLLAWFGLGRGPVESADRSAGVVVSSEPGPPIMTGGPPPIGVTASDRACRIYVWNSEPGLLLCKFNGCGRASSTVGRSEVSCAVGKTGRWIHQGACAGHVHGFSRAPSA